MGSIIDFVELNPVSTAIGVGAAGIGLGVGAAALVGAASKTKTRKSRKGRSRDRRFISKQKHERNRKRKTPGRIYKRKGLYLSRSRKVKGTRKARRSTSRKVYYARKTGQPYIKLASGKARFIKGKRRKR